MLPFVFSQSVLSKRSCQQRWFALKQFGGAKVSLYIHLRKFPPIIMPTLCEDYLRLLQILSGCHFDAEIDKLQLQC